MRRFVIAAALMIIAAHGAGAGEQAPGDLLPADGELDGWYRDGEMLAFTPENLWEYINGAAETFLMYDFIEVAAQHYIDGGELEIKIEIYRHGDPLMAFGIYTQLRSPEGTYMEIGNEAFGDEFSIHFWKGRYYVKVYAFEEGGKSAAALTGFARLVADRIPAEGGEPAETALFPREGLIEKSITYVTEGAMGSGKFPPAFTGDYVAGEKKGRLYIFSLGSDKDAAGLFAWYAGELGAGAGEAGQEGAGYSVAEGEAPYRGHVKVFTTGRFVGIITGFEAGSDAAGAIADAAAALMAGA